MCQTGKESEDVEEVKGVFRLLLHPWLDRTPSLLPVLASGERALITTVTPVEAVNWEFWRDCLFTEDGGGGKE